MTTGSRGARAGVYALVAVLLALPMLFTEVPLGVDTLDHLARIHVRAHIAGDPSLARFYVLRDGPIPYLGMDLLLAPLARVLPTLVVARVFVVALAWGLVAGVAVVRRAVTGRAGLAPAAAGLLGYNGLVAWGFLNFELGLVAALFAFAAWHAARGWPWLARLGAFTLISTALYFTHLLAFVVYGAMVAGYELLGRPRPWRTPWRDHAVLVGQAIPALLFWHALNLPAPAVGPAFFNDVGTKLLVLGSPLLFRGANGGIDAGIAVGLPILAGLALAAARGWVRCPRLLWAPALALAILALVIPNVFLHVLLVDERFPLPAACLLLAGLRLTPAAARAARPLAVAVAGLMVLHTADVTSLMVGCNAQYAELRRALALLPAGVELATVLDDGPAACTRLPIYNHAAQLVVIDRSGYAPDFFAAVTSVGVNGGRATDADPPSPAEAAPFAPGQYVLWMHMGHREAAPPGLPALVRGSFFDLLRAPGGG